MAQVRRLLSETGHHIDPVPFLNKFETKCRRWCVTPGEVFSIAGPGQRIHKTPIPLQTSLLNGDARVIKFAKKVIHMPSVRQIASAYLKTGNRNIVEWKHKKKTESDPTATRYFYLHKEKQDILSEALVQTVWKLQNASTFTQLEALWEDLGILVDAVVEEPENSHKKID